MVGSVIEAEITHGFTPLLWAVGLIALPGGLLAAHWAWRRRGGRRLDATGPIAGCELLAIYNWLLRRDDQIGCIVFAPVDLAESRRRRYP
jgi:hypothetical protein